MKEFLEKNKFVIIIAVVEIVVGILLLADPERFTVSVLKCGGIFGIIMAIYYIYCYFHNSIAVAMLKQDLFKGLMLAFCGIFLFADTEWFLKVFRSVTVLYGIATLSAGLFKVQWAINELRLNNSDWFFVAFTAIVSLIGSCLIFVNPFSSKETTMVFAGIAFIVSALCDIYVMVRKYLPALRKNRKAEKAAGQKEEETSEPSQFSLDIKPLFANASEPEPVPVEEKSEENE